MRGKDPAWDVRIVAMTGSSSLMVVLFVCVSDAVAVELPKPHRSSSGNHIRSGACVAVVILGHVGASDLRTWAAMSDAVVRVSALQRHSQPLSAESS